MIALASIWPDTPSELTFGGFGSAPTASLLADCTCIWD